MRRSPTTKAGSPPPSRRMRWEEGEMIRIPQAVRHCALLVALSLAAMAPAARADYAVLQSGQRIHITGYENVGDALRLTMSGGTMEIPADALLRIDPEDTFLPVKIKLLDVPFASFIATS